MSGTAMAGPNAPGALQVHYQGNTYRLTPGNWHGAKDCAIVTAAQAYCFNTDAELAAFTSTSRAADGSSNTASLTFAFNGTCNGWAKIWNGPNFTNTGLAFQNFGSQQNLSDYVPVPFNVVSWFTDGQRGYSSMTNCWGVANDPGGVVLHTNAQANNLGTGIGVSVIQLNFGVN